MSLPPFRRPEPADPEHALVTSANELTKEWIVRLVEHSPLDQIRELPTDRIVHEVPPLIEEILRAVLLPGEGPDISPGSELHRRVQSLATIRDSGTLTPQLPRDIAALETVLLMAVKERLASDPPGAPEDRLDLRLALGQRERHALELADRLAERRPRLRVRFRER